MFTVKWLAALGLLVLLPLGAAEVAEAPDGGAVPVGLENPVTPPEKGPGATEADAP
jgi:hypothetical protein